MPRTFLCLVSGNLIVVVGAGVLGFLAPDLGRERHIALAMFALLVSCLIQVVTFTYFSVGGKMLAQALHLGHLELTPLMEAKDLKRSAMRSLAVVFAAVVIVTATGAAHWRSSSSANLHLAAAGAAILAHLAAWYRQYALIVRHSELLALTLTAYAAARETRRAAAAPHTAPPELVAGRRR
ncbi:MAG: hypothetical protein HY763_06490 [Planctomycetes bacterium]|nr:hypothetical protein [Planctomycetota bacterium]